MPKCYAINVSLHALIRGVIVEWSQITILLKCLQNVSTEAFWNVKTKLEDDSALSRCLYVKVFMCDVSESEKQINTKISLKMSKMEEIGGKTLDKNK